MGRREDDFHCKTIIFSAERVHCKVLLNIKFASWIELRGSTEAGLGRIFILGNSEAFPSETPAGPTQAREAVCLGLCVYVFTHVMLS